MTLEHPDLDQAIDAARTLDDSADYQQHLAVLRAIFASLLHTTEYKADYVDAAAVSGERPDRLLGRLFTGGIRLRLHGNSHILVSAVIETPGEFRINVNTTERTQTACQQFEQVAPYIAGVIQGAMATDPRPAPAVGVTVAAVTPGLMVLHRWHGR
ncbi:hypothetical protein [Curtobacterium sp. MCBD17_030]|uniref:hypothetical protein n=1 Tax=Curtobacterium sp. MCBD17_030 TaxID=2175649 RepID=UPI000D9871B7|nr:hypothetical protein [Curtobacterium sp. MCBD17_030]PYY32275.1 hypothetical protein DEI89_13695 [Curtobacterium sp. MCBD17_030]